MLHHKEKFSIQNMLKKKYAIYSFMPIIKY